VSLADLRDITDTSFTDDTVQNPINAKRAVTDLEAHQALSKQKSWKTLGSDRIPAGVLKAIGKPLTKALAQVATNC
jgi:hypothetical protein